MMGYTFSRREKALLVVLALLDNLALIDDYDLICMSYSFQSMGNHDDCLFSSKILNCLS